MPICFRDSFICEVHCALPGPKLLSDYAWCVYVLLLCNMCVPRVQHVCVSVP